MEEDHITRDFIDVFRQTSGEQWAYLDSPIPISVVGDYGKLNRNGKFDVEGNVYHSHFQEYLRKEFTMDISTHPPESGESEQDYVVASTGVREREFKFKVDQSKNIPQLSSASVKGSWTPPKGNREVLVILHSPHRIFLPIMVLTTLLYAKRLQGKQIVTGVLACPAYSLYLWGGEYISIPAACDVGAGWWMNNEGVLTRRASNPKGDWFAPIFSLCEIVKRSSRFSGRDSHRGIAFHIHPPSLPAGLSSVHVMIDEDSCNAPDVPGQTNQADSPSYLSSTCDSSSDIAAQSQMSELRVECGSPLDLTPYVVKIGDRYCAGGGFGDVYRGWYNGALASEKVQVAIKAFRFKFADADSKTLKMLQRELGIWRRLNHPNIVPFLGIAYGFGMQDAMSLVSLWMSNDTLQNFLTKHDDNLAVVYRLQLLLDIANGLQYLHSLSIVHGDVNCNNVLLDADYTARLSDFGYASLVGNTPEALTYLRRSTTRPGALRWAAPEQIAFEDDTSIRTTKSDIYSFGCVGLQVVSGQQPWSEVREDAAVVLRLARGHKPSKPKFRPVDDLHWNLLESCWSSVQERPTVEAVVTSIQYFMTYYLPFRPLRDIMDASENSMSHELSEQTARMDIDT